MFSKNINERIAPASITKLMTAILFLEKYGINEQLTIKIENNNIAGKIAYLESNKLMYVDELLDFLLVFSANDAAHSIALAVSDSEDDFIMLMNQKAISFGMNNTHFQNVHGLDEPDHYSTLNDLLLLSLEVIKYDEIIVSVSKKFFYSDAINGVPVKYYSTNELLDKNFNGLKTGWTTNAGLTFIGLYQGVERNILTLVNKSESDQNKQNHFIDTQLLKDLSLRTYDEREILKKDEPLASVFNGYGHSSIYSPNTITIFGNLSESHQVRLSDMSDETLRYVYSVDESFLVPLPKTPKLSIVKELFFWLFK